MTVGHMRRTMSSSEWTEWAALYDIEAEERKRAERKHASAGRRRR
jgi:hypothetical protein